ncbi:hypothetical protein Tco_0874290 [Tanacetum coccineum]|uniref:Uncharacterized protein n=1 Tax=Tanacetum coccineum TaxID=301880 RepID=A0ABQ5BQD7_9ASTR
MVPLQPRFGVVTDWYLSQGYREPVVMSSASSAVTYTSVYTDSEPGRVFWGADEEISDRGIPLQPVPISLSITVGRMEHELPTEEHASLLPRSNEDDDNRGWSVDIPMEVEMMEMMIQAISSRDDTENALLGFRYEIGESSTARPTRDLAEAVPEIAPMTVGDVNTRVTELAALHEHDTQDLYVLLEDA